MNGVTEEQMIGIIVLVLMFSICRYIFMEDYNRVKRAHKFMDEMELWNDEDEEEELEEAKKKNNGKNSPNNKALKKLKDFDTLWDDITE